MIDIHGPLQFWKGNSFHISLFSDLMGRSSLDLCGFRRRRLSTYLFSVKLWPVRVPGRSSIDCCVAARETLTFYVCLFPDLPGMSSLDYCNSGRETLFAAPFFPDLPVCWLDTPGRLRCSQENAFPVSRFLGLPGLCWGALSTSWRRSGVSCP